MAYDKFLRAKRIAQAIINDLGIRLPEQIELELIAIDRGVFPYEACFSGADARLVTSEFGEGGIATINSNIPEEGRKRFALAHEIGHFELHRTRSKSWSCSESDFVKLYRREDSEVEANVFAAELLMPDKIFREACVGIAPGFGSICRLADLFKTSLSSTAYRYVENGNHPCALVCIKESEIAWFCSTDDFAYRIHPVSTEISKDSAAGEFFEKGIDPPDRAEPTPSEFWIEGDGPNKLFESSIAMSRYRTVLTMLWEP